MRTQIVFSVLIFLASVLGTVVHLQQILPTWDERLAQMSLPDEDLRNPAALGRMLNISKLQGEALFRPNPNRLVLDANWIRERDRFGVQLGHFVAKDSQRRPTTSCALYGRVEVVFRAEGIAVSGEAPRMIVDGACQLSPDGSHLQTLWIPVRELRQAEVRDADFMAVGAQAVKVSLYHMPGHWPATWRLEALRLYDPTGVNREIALGEDQIRRLLKRPVEWVFDVSSQPVNQ